LIQPSQELDNKKSTRRCISVQAVRTFVRFYQISHTRSNISAISVKIKMVLKGVWLDRYIEADSNLILNQKTASREVGEHLTIIVHIFPSPPISFFRLFFTQLSWFSVNKWRPSFTFQQNAVKIKIKQQLKSPAIRNFAFFPIYTATYKAISFKYSYS
jgi:hypothetical protein